MFCAPVAAPKPASFGARRAEFSTGPVCTRRQRRIPRFGDELRIADGLVGRAVELDLVLRPVMTAWLNALNASTRNCS